MEKLSGIKHNKNFQESLEVALQRRAKLMQPMQVSIPMKGAPDDRPSCSILLPHELLHGMYSGGGWDKSIVPADNLLPKFWANFRQHPCMQGHPIFRRDDFERRAVPLCLHGDEVPVVGVGKIWCHSVLQFSFNSLLATAAGRSAADTQMFIWGIFEKFVLPETMPAFFELLRWSFEVCLSGKWPAKDWRGVRYPPGTPEARRSGSLLCGGYYGVLVQMNGDLDYFAKWLETPRWSNHLKPCSLCRATFTGSLSWLDNRAGSPWQGSSLTVDDWRSHWSPSNPIFRLPGMSGLACSMDLMHNLYLGWLQYFYGSTLVLLVEDCLPNSPLDNLLYIAQFIKEHQKGAERQFKQRLHKLTMIRPKKGFPKIRGRAADVQSLHGALLSLFSQKMDNGNPQHRQIRLFLQLNNKLQNLLDEYSPSFGFMAMPEAPADELVKTGLGMAQVHAMLMDHYQGEGRRLYNMTSKTHFSIHSLLLAKFVHPAMTWCYKGESTMHRLQVLWKACLPGCKHWQVGMKAALKERYLLWLRGKL